MSPIEATIAYLCAFVFVACALFLIGVAVGNAIAPTKSSDADFKEWMRKNTPLKRKR